MCILDIGTAPTTGKKKKKKATKNPLMDLEAVDEDEEEEEEAGESKSSKKKSAGNWKDVQTKVNKKDSSIKLTLFAPARYVTFNRIVALPRVVKSMTRISTALREC